MDLILPLITLAFVQLLAVVSPGQSFVVISKTALANGRKPAFAATLGLGVGSVIWALAAIGGLAFVLEQAAWLYGLLKVAGGLYLLFLAVVLWKKAPEKPERAAEPASERAPGSHPGRAFLLGLTTQLANPKVVVFFGSIFFALLPSDAPNWLYAASLGIVFCNEVGWYALVAVFFSVAGTRRFYLRAKVWIDRTMALALGAIGIGLLFDAKNTLADAKNTLADAQNTLGR